MDEIEIDLTSTDFQVSAHCKIAKGSATVPDWNRVEASTKAWWRPVPMSPYPPARLHGEIGGIQNGSQRSETKKFGTRLNTKKGQLEMDNFKIKCNLKTVAFFLVLYLFYFLIQYILLL